MKTLKSAKKRIIISTALLLSVIVLSSTLAQGAEDTYTLTLRYRDDVQITYNINYPGRGVWTGAEDVPIGGTEISSQVYCIDPFTPFHSRVAGLGGTTQWIWPATVDTLSGYVSGVPWAYSGAMTLGEDEVNWVVVNGYRGDFLANDRESQDSVARLKTMYPEIAANIDKEVAMMATKVAIWKILANDDVSVVSTTLDSAGGLSARRDAFNKLTELLVSDAKSNRATTVSSSVTTFEITLDKTGVSPQTPDGTYNYYGPYKIKADLVNGAINTGGTIGAYLQVLGEASAGIIFSETADSAQALESGTIYGTTQSAQYIEVVNGVDTDFYLCVPVGRTLENDKLTVEAFAGAIDVNLAEGTPVSYLYHDVSAQNWDTIQAFIGAARTGTRANLYARASFSTIDEHGRIYISKVVEGATPIDADAEFTFQLQHAPTAGGTWTTVDLSEYPIYGAFSVDFAENTFTLKNGGLAYIDGLPASTSDFFRVEEINLDSAYQTPHFNIDIAAAPIPASGNSQTSSAFQIDGDLDVGMVTFYNSRWPNRERANLAFLWVGKVASDNLFSGRLVAGTYDFVLEGRAIETENPWVPIVLSGENIDDPSKIVTPGMNGTFRLSTTQAAFFELDPALEYRVTETDPGAGYSYITYATRLYDRAGMTFDTQAERVEALRWNDVSSETFSTSSLNIDEDHQLRVAFGNYALGTHELRLTKRTAGNIPADMLFQFRITLMRPDAQGSLEPVAAVPLSVNEQTGTWVVSGNGITADRLSGQGNTVLSLKSGETAIIHNVMEGTYIIEELTTDYAVTYTVGDGNTTTAVNGVSGVIEVDNNVAVVFTNTRGEPRSPQTGDERGFLLEIAVIAFGFGCIITAEVYRRRNRSSNHGGRAK